MNTIPGQTFYRHGTVCLRLFLPVYFLWDNIHRCCLLWIKKRVKIKCHSYVLSISRSIVSICKKTEFVIREIIFSFVFNILFFFSFHLMYIFSFKQVGNSFLFCSPWFFFSYSFLFIKISYKNCATTCLFIEFFFLSYSIAYAICSRICFCSFTLYIWL